MKHQCIFMWIRSSSWNKLHICPRFFYFCEKLADFQEKLKIADARRLNLQFWRLPKKITSQGPPPILRNGTGLHQMYWCLNFIQSEDVNELIAVFPSSLIGFWLFDCVCLFVEFFRFLFLQKKGKKKLWRCKLRP